MSLYIRISSEIVRLHDGRWNKVSVASDDLSEVHRIAREMCTHRTTVASRVLAEPHETPEGFSTELLVRSSEDLDISVFDNAPA